MTELRPGDGTGAPVATAHPDHQPIVPTAGGIPPRCSCGWKSAYRPAPGEYLADHLRTHDPAYGIPAVIQCRHCQRPIVYENGSWVDPEAVGDDSIWRETCEDHDTFEANHEPVSA